MTSWRGSPSHRRRRFIARCKETGDPIELSNERNCVSDGSCESETVLPQEHVEIPGDLEHRPVGGVVFHGELQELGLSLEETVTDIPAVTFRIRCGSSGFLYYGEMAFGIGFRSCYRQTAGDAYHLNRHRVRRIFPSGKPCGFADGFDVALQRSHIDEEVGNELGGENARLRENAGDREGLRMFILFIHERVTPCSAFKPLRPGSPLILAHFHPCVSLLAVADIEEGRVLRFTFAEDGRAIGALFSGHFTIDTIEAFVPSPGMRTHTAALGNGVGGGIQWSGGENPEDSEDAEDAEELQSSESSESSVSSASLGDSLDEGNYGSHSCIREYLRFHLELVPA